MSTFKILVTSQKGGVGKSTVSANLAAFMRRQGQTVTLIDFDTHGSSSTWLTRAPNIGVVVQHHILPLDQGGNRPILDARLHPPNGTCQPPPLSHPSRGGNPFCI
jgi:cellulose biosynthesis protein BcsQ